MSSFISLGLTSLLLTSSNIAFANPMRYLNSNPPPVKPPVYDPPTETHDNQTHNNYNQRENPFYQHIPLASVFAMGVNQTVSSYNGTSNNHYFNITTGAIITQHCYNDSLPVMNQTFGWKSFLPNGIVTKTDFSKFSIIDNKASGIWLAPNTSIAVFANDPTFTPNDHYVIFENPYPEMKVFCLKNEEKQYNNEASGFIVSSMMKVTNYTGQAYPLTVNPPELFGNTRNSNHSNNDDEYDQDQHLYQHENNDDNTMNNQALLSDTCDETDIWKHNPLPLQFGSYDYQLSFLENGQFNKRGVWLKPFTQLILYKNPMFQLNSQWDATVISNPSNTPLRYCLTNQPTIAMISPIRSMKVLSVH